jgi:hypothetical protein
MGHSPRHSRDSGKLRSLCASAIACRAFFEEIQHANLLASCAPHSGRTTSYSNSDIQSAFGAFDSYQALERAGSRGWADPRSDIWGNVLLDHWNR